MVNKIDKIDGMHLVSAMVDKDLRGEVQYCKKLGLLAEMKHLKNNKCEMLVKRSIVAPMQ